MEGADGRQDLYARLRPLLISPIKGPGDNLNSFCPVHEASGTHKRRSLSLSPTKGLTCWAGCEFKDVLEALEGRKMPSLVQRINGASEHGPEPESAEVTKRLTAVYQYKDEHGTVIAEKARFELSTKGDDGKPRKEFKWKLPGADSWAGLKPLTLKDIPLWGAELLHDADPSVPVYICEGEKATQACREQGLLAVCHGGGSSTREQIGECLNVLTGRDVRLWPDNDVPGRQYMTFLEAALRPLAKAVNTVNVALPEKGDAWDWFYKQGGTVEQIQKAVLLEPALEYLADDSVRIRFPAGIGIVNATFSEIERSARALESELSLTVEQPGQRPGSAYTQRINLISASQVTELRRSLQEVYGKDWQWATVLNALVAMVRASYSERDVSIDACEIDDDPDERVMLVDPILPVNSPTIFFGDGGSAKTYILLRLLLSAVRGETFLGMDVPFMSVLFVDYEGNEKTFRRRLRRLAQGLGLEDIPAFMYYWPAKGIPLHDLVYAIKKKVEKDGIGLLVVDSIAPACGGKPEDAEVALRYFRALQRIGITSANIAHVTKAQGADHPFGSIFWHNESRSTWFVKREQEEESDDIDVGLFNKKSNEGPRSKPIGMQIHFEGKQGPVTVEHSPLSDDESMQGARPLKERLKDLLRQYPLTIQQIYEQLGGATSSKYSTKVIDNCLRGSKKLFIPVGRSDSGSKGQPAVLWSLKTDREEYSI